MKPLSLTLQAFGAYAGQHTVPFAELAELGLFTVTGPTGSGKTTIFDALAYALFGGVPGERPTAEIRSHHAEPSTVTEVRLEFEVRGERWAVERSPEQAVMGARKVRRQVAEARLFRWDGARWQGVDTGPRRVDPRVEELVGLNLHQFERVVLLPQGRFQQFLLSGTRGRRELLRHLFGTEVYERVTDALLARAGALRDQIAASDESVRHHVANAHDALAAVFASLAQPRSDHDDRVELAELRADLVALEPTIDQHEAALHAAETELATVRLAAQRTTDLADRWRRRALWLQHQHAHIARRDQVDAHRTTVERGVRAAPVGAAVTALAAAQAALEAARAGLERARRRLARVQEQAGLPSGEPVTAAVIARRVESTRAAATALDALRRAQAEVEAIGARRAALDLQGRAVTERLAAMGTEATTLHERTTLIATLAEQIANRQVDAERAERALRQRGEYDAAAQRVESTVSAARAAREFLDQVTQQFVRGFAPRLAAALEPGDPCPVCGATEHPAPADGHPDATVGPADLELAQTQAHDAMAAEGRAVSDLHLLGLELGPTAELSLADVESAARRAADALRASRGAADELQHISRRLHEIGQATSDAERERAELQLLGARLDERFAIADTERERLAPIADTWSGVDLGASLDALDRADTLLVQADDLRRHALLADDRVADATAALAAALATSGFSTIDDAVGAVLDPAREARLRQVVDEWQREGAEIEATLSAIAADDLPAAEPDATVLVERADHLQALVAEQRGTAVRLRHLHTQGMAAVDAASQEARRSAPLRADFELAEAVARTCNGQGPGRIALESWVLASELEQVTAAANVHLARMSAGRYRLERTDDAGHAAKQAGLDLAVLDSHTGRERPTSTLSGGEQFQASLALALGLADVVGNAADASATGFDALFVDEGFGSLDADALDLAVAALDELRGGGRMVAVITHVEALKSALPTGVEVVARSDGSGSTIRAALPAHARD